MGDPASIGPEIAIKALLNEGVHAICRPLLVGDAGVFNDIVQRLQITCHCECYFESAGCGFKPGVVDVFDLKNVDMSRLVFGEISAMAGGGFIRGR